MDEEDLDLQQLMKKSGKKELDMQRLRETEAWKERAEEIKEERGRECEWCGSKEDLQVHHTSMGDLYIKVRRIATKGWSEVAYELFQESEELEKLPEEKKDVCPNCEASMGYVNERKTMEPKWRCNKCGEEFSTPKKVKTGKKRKEEFKEGLKKFKKNKEEEITSLFKARKREYIKYYFTTDDVKVLCKSCHTAAHNDMKICESCGEEYGEYRRGLEKYLCWGCFTEEKGLKKCPECGDKWYNPKKYDKCKKCRRRIEGPKIGTWKCKFCGEEMTGSEWEPPLDHAYDCPGEDNAQKVGDNLTFTED